MCVLRDRRYVNHVFIHVRAYTFVGTIGLGAKRARTSSRCVKTCTPLSGEFLCVSAADDFPRACAVNCRRTPVIVAVPISRVSDVIESARVNQKVGDP